MIRSKTRDENEPRIDIKTFARPITTLPGFGNPPDGFSYLRDLVKTDTKPWFDYKLPREGLLVMF